MSSQKQQGFAALEALLLVVIVAILAGVGYYVWSTNNSVDKTVSTQSSTSSSSSTKSELTTYTNKQFNFQFSYPSDWGKVSLTSITSSNNKAAYSVNFDKVEKFTGYIQEAGWKPASDSMISEPQVFNNCKAPDNGTTYVVHQSTDVCVAMIAYPMSNDDGTITPAGVLTIQKQLSGSTPSALVFMHNPVFLDNSNESTLKKAVADSFQSKDNNVLEDYIAMAKSIKAAQ